MNQEIQELLATSENAGEAAGALVRWAKEDAERLRLAAVAWLEARDRLPRAEFRYGDGRAVVRLLMALPDGSAEYTGLFALLDRDNSPVLAELDVVTLLAPARATPVLWSRLLLPWIEAGNGHPSKVLYSFGERMPALTYELLSAMEAREQWGDEASSNALALAVSRIGLKTTFEHEASRVATLTAERLLSDHRIFWFAMMSVRDRRPGPPVLNDALALAFAGRGKDWQTYFVRGLQILKAQGKREELIELLCSRIKAEPSFISELVKGASEEGNRLFFGWGQDEGARLMGRLGRTLLEAGTWPTWLWRHTLPEKFLNGDPTEKRELAILTESLFQIADDPTVPLSDRRRSLEALGRTGVGRMAMRLGKLKAHPELAEDVKRARTQLARSGKGHEVDPENGLRLALNHMNVRAAK